MKEQAGLWDVDERYARLSAAGDPLERLNTVVAWEMFRKPLAKALNRPDRSQGGRRPYDAVMMFKVLVLRALYGLSDEQAEFQIMDRRTFGRSLGLLDVGDRVDTGCWPPPTPARKCGPTRRYNLEHFVWWQGRSVPAWGMKPC
ncbi:MAG: transposase [Mesorhizobium sp.]|nr:MAG: transposase [Mesorhizobium sp.]